jgi:hypothetical protein
MTTTSQCFIKAGRGLGVDDEDEEEEDDEATTTEKMVTV